MWMLDINALLDHNVLFYAKKYDCSIENIIGDELSNIIRNCVYNHINDQHLHMADFVHELVSIRENTLALSNGGLFPP